MKCVFHIKLHHCCVVYLDSVDKICVLHYGYLFISRSYLVTAVS
jgi:hypothetical protein